MEPEQEPYRELVTAPQTVVGYHGCSLEVARQILEQQRFIPSTKAYDWLGEGIYFWEYAPYRALQWAQERSTVSDTSVAVIGATIQLGRCLNLLDVEYMTSLAAVYAAFAALGVATLPRNTNRGAHYLDRYIIDAHCREIEEAGLAPVQTVRGSFAEGSPVYAGSKILDKSHVQIAVRDATCLSDLHMARWS